MTVITDYRHERTNITTFCIYNGTSVYEFKSDEFMDEVTNIIENTKSEKYLYISNLDLIGLRLIYNLCIVGYNIKYGNVKNKDMKEKDFCYLISAEGDFYNIKIKRKKRILHIYNIDKLLTLSDRRDIIDAWGHKERPFYSPKNYAYAAFDAISLMNTGFQRSLPCTLSSTSRKKFNSSFNFFILKSWIKDMRDYNLDDFLRPAYHGGICFLNWDLTSGKHFERCVQKNGVVVDKNSMYPWIMRNKPLPYGEPVHFKGEPTEEMKRHQKNGNIYIYVKVKTSFDIKPGKIPCIQCSGEQLADHETGCMKSSKRFNKLTGKYMKEKPEIELTLTYTDLMLLFECYDVHKIKYIEGVYFPTTRRLFKRFVDQWYFRKQHAQTKGERRISKMMLNTLSGNFAKRIDTKNLILEYDGNQLLIDDEENLGVIASTIHIGAAITAYAREEIVKLGNKFYNRLLYIDTDSLHLLGTDLSGIDIGDKLGQYKIEHKFQEAVYYKPKMYAMKENGNYFFKLAGVPKQSVEFLEQVVNCKFNYSGNHDVILPDILDHEYSYARYDTMMGLIKNGFKFSKYQDPLLGIMFLDDKKGKFIELGCDEKRTIVYTTIERKMLDFLKGVSTLKARNELLTGIVNLSIPIWCRSENDEGFTENLNLVFRDITSMNKFL